MYIYIYISIKLYIVCVCKHAAFILQPEYGIPSGSLLKKRLLLKVRENFLAKKIQGAVLV